MKGQNIRQAVVFWLSLCLAAWNATPSLAAERLMLWEASGARATVYLYGSIHVCKPDCFPLDKAVLRRFDASHALAVELDPEKPDARDKLMAAAILPNGEQLNDKLDADTRARLSKVLAKLGVSEAAVSAYQPWMVSTLITVLSAQRLGYDPALGVDAWLMKRANAQQKPILELETVERQITALSGGTEDEQLDGLRLVLKLIQSDRAKGYLAELLEAWRDGNSEHIDALTQESMPSGSSLSAELIDQRNAEMAERIAKFLQQNRKIFVAVGAAHLSGPKGIPALLGKKGFRVKQIGDAPRQ